MKIFKPRTVQEWKEEEWLKWIESQDKIKNADEDSTDIRESQ